MFKSHKQAWITCINKWRQKIPQTCREAICSCKDREPYDKSVPVHQHLDCGFSWLAGGHGVHLTPSPSYNYSRFWARSHRELPPRAQQFGGWPGAWSWPPGWPGPPHFGPPPPWHCHSQPELWWHSGLVWQYPRGKTKLFNKLSLPMTYRAILINHILVYKAVPNSIMMKAVYFCHEQD